MTVLIANTTLLILGVGNLLYSFAASLKFTSHHYGKKSLT